MTSKWSLNASSTLGRLRGFMGAIENCSSTHSLLMCHLDILETAVVSNDRCRPTRNSTEKFDCCYLRQICTNRTNSPYSLQTLPALSIMRLSSMLWFWRLMCLLRLQIWSVRRPHIWHDECWSLTCRDATEFGNSCNFKVTQGSVVTHLRWDGKTCNVFVLFVQNFLRVEKFWNRTTSQ